MNQFHRIVRDQPKRHVGDKKRIRDIERMLDREGLPKDIRETKLQQLREAKKQFRQKQAAEKNEGMYKKIKFIEKRKVIRKIE